MRNIFICAAFAFSLTSCGGGAGQTNSGNVTPTEESKASTITASQTSVREIWNSGLHAAFTDLAFFNDKFYVAFREGPGHDATEGNGSIRVICFEEDGPIEEVIHIEMDADLRDPKLLILSDGNIYVTFAGFPPSGAGPRTIKNYVANLASRTVVAIDESLESWLWRMSVVGPRLMGFSYKIDSLASDPVKGLFVVLDENFSVLEKIASPISGECTIRKSTVEKIYAICRGRDNSMKLGVLENSLSRNFAWSSISPAIGGPNFVVLNDEFGLIGGRFYGNRGLRTSIASISFSDGKVTELLRLPSGGDTGYPGLLLDNNTLYVSYYYQPSGANYTNIYFARVQVQLGN